jgi:hypothetical protein
LRAGGITSRWLLGLLAWSCGWIDSIRDCSAQELIQCFRLNTISKEPYVLEQLPLPGNNVQAARR